MSHHLVACVLDPSRLPPKLQPELVGAKNVLGEFTGLMKDERVYQMLLRYEKNR